MCRIVVIHGTRQSLSVCAQLNLALNHMKQRSPYELGMTIADDGQKGIAMCRLLRCSTHTYPFPLIDVHGVNYVFDGDIFSDENVFGTQVVLRRGKEAEVSLKRACCPNGMWASAKLSQNGNISLSRDPWGIKPLWVRDFEEGCHAESSAWMAASSLQPLLHCAPSPVIRKSAVAQFLLAGQVYDGGSFWSGVRPYPPGACGGIGQKPVPPKQRLSLTVDRVRRKLATAKSEAEESAIIRKSISQSVAYSLSSEHCTGLAISGGLDSTILAWHIRELGYENLRTVSIKVAGGDDGVSTFKDLSWEGEVPKSWKHFSRTIGPTEYLALLKRSVCKLNQPTALTSAPLYLALAELAFEAGITLLLVGEGADELWGGYRSYLRITPTSSPIDFYLTNQRFSLVKALLGGDVAETVRNVFVDCLPNDRGGRAILDAEQIYSLHPLLERANQLMIDHAIEVRTPFLYGDSWVIANDVSWSDLVDGAQTKVRLRAAYKDQLPKFVVEDKKPFRAPWNRWLAAEFGVEVKHTISSVVAELEELGISKVETQNIVARGVSGDALAADFTFRLYTLALWLIQQGV